MPYLRDAFVRPLLIWFLFKLHILAEITPAYAAPSEENCCWLLEQGFFYRPDALPVVGTNSVRTLKDVVFSETRRWLLKATVLHAALRTILVWGCFLTVGGHGLQNVCAPCRKSFAPRLAHCQSRQVFYCVCIDCTRERTVDESLAKMHWQDTASM